MDGLFEEGEEKKVATRKSRKKAKGDDNIEVKEDVQDVYDEPESFEAAVGELEEIVERLDRGNVNLEESVELYRKGQFLTKWCGDVLDKYEGKLKILIRDGSGSVDAVDVDGFGG
jgi:exodeoxyribonuclease VII small subunit